MIMLNEVPPGPLIRQCCVCSALARPSGEWVDFVMDADTAEKVKLKATHTYCPKCEAIEIAKLKQGRAGQ